MVISCRVKIITRFTYSFNVGGCNLPVGEKPFRGHHDPAMRIKNGTSQNYLLSSVGRARPSSLRKHRKDEKDEAGRNRLLHISIDPRNGLEVC